MIWNIKCEECNEIIGYSNDYRKSHDLRTLVCPLCTYSLEEDEDEDDD